MPPPESADPDLAAIRAFLAACRAAGRPCRAVLTSGDAALTVDFAPAPAANGDTEAALLDAARRQPGGTCRDLAAAVGLPCTEQIARTLRRLTRQSRLRAEGAPGRPKRYHAT